MNNVTAYIFNMAPFMLLAIPLYVGIRAIVIRKELQNKRVNPFYEWGLLFYVVFLVGLASQTIVPNIMITDSGWYLGQPGIGGFNYTPFKVFKQTYYEVFVNKNLSYFTINFIGNIVIFMPVSFFPLLLFWHEHKLRRSLSVGFFTSFFIELAQIPIERGSDIDDLWLNTLGAFVGFLIYRVVEKKHPAFCEKFKKARVYDAKTK